MINRLRNKFIIIMMSIVTLILGAIFFALYTSTQTNLEMSSQTALIQELNNIGLPGKQGLPPKNFMAPPEGFRSPALLVKIDDTGSFEVIKNHFYTFESADLEEISTQVLLNMDDYGVLKEYRLRYMLKEENGQIYIAFVDTSIETQVIRTMVINSLGIGFISLLVFFLLSVFLARWAIKPVKDAWQQQKQFIADASHELKTPLTVILSNAEMLVDAPGNREKEIQRLDNILQEGRRMKNLVEDMLALARSDYTSNKIITPVNFSEIVINSALLYESELYDERKRFDYQTAENIYVNGDEDKLRRLVDILLDNSRKFTAENGLISLSLYLENGKDAHLSVFNEGEAIPDEELIRIFQRFYRTDESRQNNGGFGLGLSIAWSITAEHKGRIWAESHAKKGNTFHVVFPTVNS